MIFLFVFVVFIWGGGVYWNNYGNVILIINFCYGYMVILYGIFIKLFCECNENF